MIIVTGAAGQLGTDVVKELSRRNIPHMGIDIAELDITDADAVDAFFREVAKAGSELRVIHCAAYTAVDKAEDELELCHKVNALGTENIARVCRELDAEMLYISTDYVFNGEGGEPYETDAPKGPLSAYGKSKLAGEEAVLRHMGDSGKYYIVRISWVFGEAGANFVKTMLRLADGGAQELSVVDDQIGSPTYTPDLAALLREIVLSRKYGTYHATNEGFCSWAEFASEIMRLRAAAGGGACGVKPIPTEQYPTKAMRPKNSRLSKKSLDDAGFSRLPPWQDALERFMKGYAQ